MKNKILFGLMLSMMMVFTYCNKDKNTADVDTSAAEDHAIAENAFNDADNVVDESIRNTPGMYNKRENTEALTTGCATISVDTSSSARVMTIDFGTGCTGNDGRLRAGKIIVSYTGRYRQTGTVITTTFDNYSVNGNKVEGKRIVTNMGPNANGHTVFKIQIKEAKITNSNGVVNWESTREREWIAGENTATILDDQYSITGTALGTNRNNIHFDATITSPLIVKVGCKWITKGTLKISPTGKADRVIDYGNGDCDDSATVTINTKSYNIKLR